MPSITLRTGVLALTGDVNAAAVCQIIMNRILAANSKELAVSDIAAACGIEQVQVREALRELHALGLVSCDGDLASCEKLQPLRFCLRVETVAEANLLTSNGMASDGTPQLLAEPTYIAGYWYKARLQFDTQDANKVVLIVDQWTHGHARSAVLEQAFDSEPEARQFLLDWTPTEVRGTWPTCPYKGKTCEVRISTRQHDGETLTLLDLVSDGTSHITFNGTSEEDCMRQLRSWHQAAAGEFDTEGSKQPRGRSKKGGTK